MNITCTSFAVATSIIFLVSLPASVNAGVMTSTTGTNITQRYCPQVNADFAAYIEKWGPTMTDPEFGFPFPSDASLITQQDACIFNTQWEQYFDDAMPGDVVSLQNIQQSINSTYIANEDGDIWLNAVLDNSQLALPEAHFVVNSDESERNSANLFSAQTYLWQGDTTTLEFSAIFDFSMSVGLWGDVMDSFYGLQIGASKNMTFAAGLLFPEDWGVELASGDYNSLNDTDIINEDINFRHLTISFEIEDGDEFQLWGRSQAFALNGGWIDSANTMRTQLNIAGYSVEESEQIFSNQLSIVSSVPEPSTMSMAVLALLGMGFGRLKKRSQNS